MMAGFALSFLRINIIYSELVELFGLRFLGPILAS